MSEKFTVTPMSNTLNLKAGETYEGYILISNPENSEGDFDYLVENFALNFLVNNFFWNFYLNFHCHFGLNCLLFHLIYFQNYL